MQYSAIPFNTMHYHAIPCNTMQYQAIQNNTMQYHTSFITADGAYHCPVGSIWPFLYLAGDLMTCGTFFFLFLFVCQSQRMWPWQVHLEPATSRFLDHNLRYRSLLHILPAVLETRRWRELLVTSAPSIRALPLVSVKLALTGLMFLI